MRVYRISRDIYAGKLTASGVASRWNHDQQWVIYSSESRSLATLELVVNSATVQPGLDYRTTVFQFPDDPELITEVGAEELPADWRDILSYPETQAIGSTWYKEQLTPILKIPSAVITAEYNYVFNTRHPRFGELIAVESTEAYFWDERLVV